LKRPRESSVLPTNVLSMFGQRLYPVLHLPEVGATTATMMAIAPREDLAHLTIFASGIIHNHLQVVTSLHQVHLLASHSQLLILTILYSLDLLVAELVAASRVANSTAKLETVVEPPARQDLLSHQPRPSSPLERLISISTIWR